MKKHAAQHNSKVVQHENKTFLCNLKFKNSHKNNLGWLQSSQQKRKDMKPNDLSNFQFRFLSAGHYRVTYTTRRGDFWVSLVTDMTLIDKTNGADFAKGVDIEKLINHVKLNGSHYSKSGQRIDCL